MIGLFTGARPFIQLGSSMALIGYIVRTDDGKFKPCIGHPIDSPDDDDQCLWQVASSESTATIEEAIESFEILDQPIKIYKAPIEDDIYMGIWISELEKLDRELTDGSE